MPHFPIALLALNPLHNHPLFLRSQPARFHGAIGKDPRKDDSEQNRRQSFEQEKPFPAGESSDAVHSQKDSGERTAKNGRCRNRHQEPGENSRAVFFRKPARQVKSNSREKSRFGGAQGKAEHVPAFWSCDEDHRG